MHVHFNAHHVFIRRQHHARRGEFAHGFNVNRLDAIDKCRFPVQARFNQMTELAETGYNAALRFFDGIEPACRPNDNRGRRDDHHNATADWVTGALS